MSSDARTADDARPPERSCSFCGAAVDAPLALQWYDRLDGDVPAGVPAHGGIDLCPDCAPEVTELLSTWTAHDDPAVDADASIVDGYRRVADACSFCDESLDGDRVAGLECYGDANWAEGVPAYANFALCAGCRPVVGQFLRDVREDCEA